MHRSHFYRHATGKCQKNDIALDIYGKVAKHVETLPSLHKLSPGLHSPQVVLLVQTVLLGQDTLADHVPLLVHVEV